MPTLRIETRIRAQREICFDLARSIDAHRGSTERTGERVAAGRQSGLMELGEEITWEARHMGVRQRLTARITRMERPRYFVDEMVKGAFAEFRHTHEFEDLGDGVTLMRDVFAYRAPLGVVGKIADSLFLARYMERFLETRAAFLKTEAERTNT
jgi:ligand-binding SRPBCC domain-containing protein